MKWHSNEATIEVARIRSLKKPRCSAVIAYTSADETACSRPGQFTMNGQHFCTMHAQRVGLAILVGDCDSDTVAYAEEKP